MTAKSSSEFARRALLTAAAAAPLAGIITATGASTITHSETLIARLGREYRRLYPEWYFAVVDEMRLEGKPGHEEAEQRSNELWSQLEKIAEQMNMAGPSCWSDVGEFASVAYLDLERDSEGNLLADNSELGGEGAAFNLIKAAVSMSRHYKWGDPL